MAYTDTISLWDAKDYLGIDDTSRDAEITRMISSALKYVEKSTNILFDVRDKIYDLDENSCVYVYDSPINTLDAALDATVTRVNKGTYSIYSDSNIDAETLTLNVGSITPDEDLLEAAYMLIDHFFNEGTRTNIPNAVDDIININRRFII